MCLCGFSARSHNIRNVYVRNRTGVGKRRHAAHGTAYNPAGWTIRSSIPGKDTRVSSSLKRSDLLWHPPSLLFSGVKGLKQRGKLTPRIYVIARLRMGRAMPLLPLIHLHGVHRGKGAHQEFWTFQRLSNSDELHLSGLIGTASHPGMKKIWIIGLFFENRLYWRFEVEEKIYELLF